MKRKNNKNFNNDFEERNFKEFPKSETNFRQESSVMRNFNNTKDTSTGMLENSDTNLFQQSSFRMSSSNTFNVKKEEIDYKSHNENVEYLILLGGDIAYGESVLVNVKENDAMNTFEDAKEYKYSNLKTLQNDIKKGNM